LVRNYLPGLPILGTFYHDFDIFEIHNKVPYNLAVFNILLKERSRMKTTIVINEELLREAMKVAGVKTKREAIEVGLRELVRRRNLEALKEELGTFDLDLSLEELERLRSEE
jgi:Arc/MetJ family transcription regulator